VPLGFGGPSVLYAGDGGLQPFYGSVKVNWLHSVRGTRPHLEQWQALSAYCGCACRASYPRADPGWWTRVIEGRVTREAAHAWAEPLMFAEYSRKPDMMVMTAIQYLDGFDMTFDPPALKHGPPGEYYRTIAQIADEYTQWCAKCDDYDRDPTHDRRAREGGEAPAEEGRTDGA